MNTTGERSSPEDISIHPIYCQHLAAYRYASGFVKDKVVLDLGCGEGYGSGMLSGYARRVIGMDYSAAAIQKASRNYNSPNLEFIRKDSVRADFENESFDVVCCFQVIEHLAHPGGLLSKITSWLKPGGILLVSTPNRKASIIRHPYHYREYSKEELGGVLKQFFPQVEVFGLQFSQRVKKFRETRYVESHRLLKMDFLKLHLLLPMFIRRKAFDFVASRLSRNIYMANRELAESIGIDDYWVSGKDIDLAIDLVASCRK